MSSAVQNVKSSCGGEARQERFLRFLPSITEQARYAFCFQPAEEREELVQEVLANAWQGYARLCDQAKEDLAYPTPLARYGIARIRKGLQVATTANSRDLTSPRCRHFNGVHVESLHRWDDTKQRWQELVIQDKKSTPAELAATRIDFSHWLTTLSVRKREIAELLATGETTADAAEKSGMTPGRISQIRRELKDAWQTFQQEMGPQPVPA